MNPDSSQILESFRSVIQHESQTLTALIPSVGEQHVSAVRLILSATQSGGKVLVTGVGKSGIIGTKIAATLNSTGTPAVFIHPTDALHGDLGMARPGDVAIAIGKSGEGDEMTALLLALKHLQIPVIAITAHPTSTLGLAGQAVLHTPVSKEACPLDLAPTASTTAAMAIGDALAITLMKLRGFKAEDFARFHPGGKLGKRLLLRVHDLMVPAARCPVLDPSKATMEDVILTLGSSGLGIVLFASQDLELSGILTDGDIRRLLTAHKARIFDLQVAETMNPNPACVPQDWKASEALAFMERRPKPLNVIPVIATEGSRKLVGVARLHEFLDAV